MIITITRRSRHLAHSRAMRQAVAGLKVACCFE